MDELIKILDKNLTYLNHEILEDTIYNVFCQFQLAHKILSFLYFL